ncbi:MAG: DUF4189 domain-containing protein [Alphaproteobacteria bacterium]
MLLMLTAAGQAAAHCCDGCGHCGWYQKGRHGAVAYSRSTGAIGWSFDYGSEFGAHGRAFGECRRRAGDCEVVTTFYGGCAAAAAAPGGPVTWGRSGNRWGAEAAALRHCQGQAQGCQVKVWACSWR